MGDRAKRPLCKRCDMQSGSIPIHLLLVLSIVCTASFINSAGGEASPRCRDDERRALLDIRGGLTDPIGRLSSWVGDDCCAWSGVRCSNKTSHIVSLDLHNPLNYYGQLGGNISSSLLHLKHLTFLDLSRNYFDGMQIPEFLGSLPRLRHLRLAEAGFGGMVPPHLGNLTNLRYLDLHWAGIPHGSPSALSLHWLSNLSYLRYLDMSRVNLSEATDWLHTVNKLSSLKVLNLDSTYLKAPPAASLPHANLSTLVVLSLSANDLGPKIPDWLYNISNLEKVDLSANEFEGPIPPALGNLSALRVLQLQFNSNIQGPVPWAFRNLCNLKFLDLSFNKVYGEISKIIEGLSGCSRISLERLNFARNQLTGQLPDGLGQFKMLKTLNLGDNMISGSIPLSIGGLSNLMELYLDNNKLNGSVPKTLGQLSNLVVLDLRFNSLTGDFSDAHFANTTGLKAIFLSSNSLNFVLPSNFVPQFQLTNIHLDSCRLGTRFPAWLQTQRQFSTLDISNAGISDTMPDWFWRNLPSRVYYLNLSHNSVIGNLSMFAKFPSVQIIDLSYNNFQGPLPPLHPDVHYLYLSHNSFSETLFNMTSYIPYTIWAISLSSNNLGGSIPSSICNMTSLEVLDLSDNHLMGEIPACWSGFHSLSFLNLARNTLHGSIPSSLGSLPSMQSLHLNENNLHGEIPAALQQCTWLVTLDLGENMLTGSIPGWIGEHLWQLRLLRLRSNKFHGSIPRELAKLSYLQVLDLAHNNLSGSIPRSFSNFSAMIRDQKSSQQPFVLTVSGDRIGYASMELRSIYVDGAVITMKGRDLEYDKTLFLVISLDLSSNNLSGDIPEELTKLVGLRSLNLSENQLTGRIPSKIGNMRNLETFDLSRNKLSGAIPSSISSLNSLVHLNLSNNGLSGRIPSGNQLRTLTDPSIYEGNPDLCGSPLQRKCPGDEVPEGLEEANSDSEGGTDMSLLYLGMGLGFAVGFWVFVGSLLLKRSWRVSYFEFVDGATRKVGCIFSTRRK